MLAKVIKVLTKTLWGNLYAYVHFMDAITETWEVKETEVLGFVPVSVSNPVGRWVLQRTFDSAWRHFRLSPLAGGDIGI